MGRKNGRSVPVLVSVAVVCLAATLWRLPSAEVSAAGHEQQIVIIDGDTIQLDGTVIQLFGIDAPELGQHCYQDLRRVECGLEAAYELRKLIFIESAPVTCSPPAGAAEPTPMVCHAGSVDFAHVLVNSGYAVTAAETTEGYREAEAKAREASLGLWHDQFVRPADWRAGTRLPQDDDPEAPSCPIKAVIEADGSRIYHVPTDDDYQAVVVDPEKGERLFCSDEDARRAGWRRRGE